MRLIIKGKVRKVTRARQELQTPLYYFRTPPLPIHQPTNTNRRTDKGENLLSIMFANYLKEATLTGRCSCTWTKIAHETSSRSHAYGNLMRNMGKLAGVPDFIFTNKDFVLWLELKDGPTKKLSPDQKFFKKWCEETGSNWELACSLQEAIAIVEDAGVVLVKCAPGKIS